MKTYLRILPLTLATALVALQGANAADYDPVVVPADEAIIDEYKPVEIGSGWYIRGDLGMGFAGSGNAISSYRTYSGGVYGSKAFDTAKVKSEAEFGVGFGYTFNRFLRADLTAERFSGKFNGSTSDAAPCPFVGATAPNDDTTCASTDTSKFTAYSLMANAYADLGTFVGITPYIGAGAGMTFLNWRGLTNTSYCVESGTDACPGGASQVTNHAGANSARFTYALMAGASYDLSKNLKFDLGYRYRHISGGDMFQFDSPTQAAGATGAQGRDKGFGSHQVRVGLRYEIW